MHTHVDLIKGGSITAKTDGLVEQLSGGTGRKHSFCYATSHLTMDLLWFELYTLGGML